MKLLIASGNRLREDDGAGHLFADRLAAFWRGANVPFRYVQVQQLVPELALDIAAEAVEELWFVDCRLAQNERDTDVLIRQLHANAHSPSIGHQLSPELLLLYAWHLFDKRASDQQPAAWQITVPGFHFGHAETVSAACQDALDRAAFQGIYARTLNCLQPS